jgi:antirestriction protein ArdC
MKSKVRDMITDRIIEQIEAGGKDFLMPFSQGSGAYRNAVSGKAYRGINVLMAGLLGQGDSVFATFNQWQKLCGLEGKESPLKEDAKGRGVPICYFKMMDKTDRETGEVTGAYPFMRYSTVFGVSQVREDVLPEKFKIHEVEPVLTPLIENLIIEQYIEDTDAIINRDGNKACYYPSRDTIEMPALNLWNDMDQYYPVLLHELTHWTKHESRCNRKQCKKWGDRDYAFEELIAELGSAFQCRTLGLHTEVRDDHSAYISAWLKAMKGDNTYIFDAAKLAQEAVDYIESLQPQVKEKAA